MKWKDSASILLLLSIIGLASYITLTMQSAYCSACTSGVEFYMYGSTTCPHCQSLKSFFQQFFPDNYYFCPIDQSQECYKVFLEFAEKELVEKANMSLNQIGVPITLVVRTNSSGKYILGIVIGAVKITDFWNTLSCSEPSENISIYYGIEKKYELPVGSVNHTVLVDSYIIHLESNKQQDNSWILAVGLIGVVVVGVIIYFFLSRAL